MFQRIHADSGLPSFFQRVQRTGPNDYECGRVKIDALKRCLRFPVRVNLDEGPLEYALVTPRGARHESLLITEADPTDIHTAALLLGAAPPGKLSSVLPSQASGGVDALSLQKMADPVGCPVRLWLSYTTDGRQVRARLESFLEWASDQEAAVRTRVPETHWLYTGSYFSGGQFAAQEEGNLIGLVISPAALINNPLPENRNDRNWYPRGLVLPMKESQMEFEVEFGVQGAVPK